MSVNIVYDENNNYYLIIFVQIDSKINGQKLQQQMFGFCILHTAKSNRSLKTTNEPRK